MKFIKNLIIWLFNYFKDVVSLLRKEIINSTIDDSNNPWNGLASYSDPDNSEGKPVKLFCGRDNETFKLTQQIKNQIFVTVYGKSGKGKTSLLNAGVCPKLREEQFFPISIRLGMLDKDVSFQDHIISEIEKQKSIRFEVIDVVKKNEEKTSIDYLWNYFARHRFYKDDKLVFPVIILDQFEEVFYNKQVQKEGKEESYNREEDAAMLLKQIYFMMDEGHALPDKEIDGNLYEYYYNFRFVVTIREDDLFKLEDTIDANYLNLMKENRFRLRSITKEGAREVILKPCENLFAEEDKDKIVDKIIEFATDKDNTIGSNVLSLLCSSIYVQKRKDSLNEPISLKYVEKIVSENPLEKLYSEATKDLSSREKAYLENNLVDVSGRRASVTKADYRDAITSGDRLLNGTTKILQESNGKIELIHDSFCPVLEKSKAQRKTFRLNRLIHYALCCFTLYYLLYIVSMSVGLANIEVDWTVRCVDFIKAFILIPIAVIAIRNIHVPIYYFIFPVVGGGCSIYSIVSIIHNFDFIDERTSEGVVFGIMTDVFLCLMSIAAVLAIVNKKELKQNKMSLGNDSSQFYIWSALIIAICNYRFIYDNYYVSCALLDLVLFLCIYSICANMKISIIIFFYVILPVTFVLLFNVRMHFPADMPYWEDLLIVVMCILVVIVIVGLYLGWREKNTLSVITQIEEILTDVRLMKVKSSIIKNVRRCLLILWFSIAFFYFLTASSKLLGIVICPFFLISLIFIIFKGEMERPLLKCLIVLLLSIGLSTYFLGYNPNLKDIDSSIQVVKWRWSSILQKDTVDKITILEAWSGDVLSDVSFSRDDEKGCLYVKSKYDFMTDTCSDIFIIHQSDTIYYGYNPIVEYGLSYRKSKQDTLSLACIAYKDFILKHLISGEEILPQQYPCYLDWLIEQEISKMQILLKTNFLEEKKYKDNQKQLFKLLDNVLSSCLLKTESVEVKECNNQKMKQLVDVFNVFVREHSEDIRKDESFNLFSYLSFLDYHSSSRNNDYDYITGFEKVADMYMKVDNGCEIDSSLSQILPLLKEEYENAKSDCSYQLNLGHKIERLEEIIKKFKSE